MVAVGVQTIRRSHLWILFHQNTWQHGRFKRPSSKVVLELKKEVKMNMNLVRNNLHYGTPDLCNPSCLQQRKPRSDERQVQDKTPSRPLNSIPHTPPSPCIGLQQAAFIAQTNRRRQENLSNVHAIKRKFGRFDSSVPPIPLHKFNWIITKAYLATKHWSTPRASLVDKKWRDSVEKVAQNCWWPFCARAVRQKAPPYSAHSAWAPRHSSDSKASSSGGRWSLEPV